MSLAQLSAAQRRGVFAALRVLEDRLDQMEIWLGRAGQERPGSRWIDDLEPGRRQELVHLIDRARQEVEAVFDKLGHAPEAISLFQRCQAALGLDWEDSLDLRGSRLRHYGPVPETLGQEMDALAERLAGLFQDMRLALGEQRP